QVAAQKLKLFVQRQLLRAGVLKSHSQKVAEPREHLIGRVGVLFEKRGNRIQGVKQEVRLQLHLQRIELSLGNAQPRFGKLGLEPRDLERLVLMPAVIFHELTEQQDHAVAQKTGRQVEQEKISIKPLKRCQSLIRRHVQQPAYKQVDRPVPCRDKQTS